MDAMNDVVNPAGYHHLHQRPSESLSVSPVATDKLDGDTALADTVNSKLEPEVSPALRLLLVTYVGADWWNQRRHDTRRWRMGVEGIRTVLVALATQASETTQSAQKGRPCRPSQEGGACA